MTDDVTEAARSEQVILAVKPQSFADVAAAIAPVTEPTVFVSIMAGLDTATLRAQLGDNARLVRVMPNTPCQLGEGMTGIALGAGARPGMPDVVDYAHDRVPHGLGGAAEGDMCPHR